MSRLNYQPSPGETIRNLERKVADLERLLVARTGTVLRGDGSPEGVVVAAVGTIWLRSDGGAGTVLYVKETGAGTTGWSAV